MVRFTSDLKDFPDLLQAVAQARRIPAAIVEKDYYLIRALRALQQKIGEQFLLKGGTSLAKGWNLLERFSEDLDLLFRVEDASGSFTKAELRRRLKNAEKIIRDTPGFTFHDKFSDDGVPHRDTHFTYPKQAGTLNALGGTILLEMGPRGDASHSTMRRVSSFVAEFAHKTRKDHLAEDLSSFEVECLDVRRTFVEKLYAAHAAYVENRAQGKARHYYDLYQLAGMPEVQGFVGSNEYHGVCKDAEGYSRQFWKGKPLPEAGFANSSAFWPDADGFKALLSHYENEADLFFGHQPPLKEILERLQSLLAKAGS